MLVAEGWSHDAGNGVVPWDWQMTPNLLRRSLLLHSWHTGVPSRSITWSKRFLPAHDHHRRARDEASTTTSILDDRCRTPPLGRHEDLLVTGGR